MQKLQFCLVRSNTNSVLESESPEKEGVRTAAETTSRPRDLGTWNITLQRDSSNHVVRGKLFRRSWDIAAAPLISVRRKEMLGSDRSCRRCHKAYNRDASKEEPWTEL
jgi:hypothetical protein